LIRRHITALRLLLVLVDVATALGLFIVVSVLRFGDDWRSAWSTTGADWRAYAAAYALGWVTVFWLHGLYRLRVSWSIRGDMMLIFRSITLYAFAVFSALFVLKLPQVSRLFLIELFVVQLAVAVIARTALRFAIRAGRARGFSVRFMVIVGSGPGAREFANRIERHRELGIRVIGHLRWPNERQYDPRRPILGTVDDIETILHDRVIDEVAICLPASAGRLVETITRLCEEEGKIVRIPLTEVGVMVPGGRIESYDGISVQSLVYGPDRILGLIAKRMMDVVFGTLFLIVLSPVLLAIGLWVRLADGAPVLFRQVRVGLNGRQFRVVKLRTMVRDAEERLADLESLNEIRGPAFKVTLDPRLSRTGRFLRATSLDELPQLWNVVVGEMSLVGPRPPLPSEVADYDLWHRRRLSMKPGITGLWQVEARRSEDFDRWVELDLAYIDRWSIWLDLKIMVKTLPAMLQGR
jgi:exopolysaccharide biosynthesis polyprenyl glycosylphosphotransferase